MVGRVIVVGSGAAGLTAALRAASEHPELEVTLLTKGVLGESNTLHAQGGVAVALGDDDSVESHLSDTLAAGAGLADRRAARILCEEGPERINDLIGLGIRFDQAPNGQPARGLEGAHSRARVLHAGGDATGREIVAVLTRAVRESRVVVRERGFVRDILVSGGETAGVRAIDMATHRAHDLPAGIVIIATGGAGQLYRHTSNPAAATGDGVAAAMRAGARLVDAEFMQFHPTTLAVAGTPLISEAVRGQGAVLLDSSGERFMPAEHPDAELAPRDVVARAIARRMELQGGAPVYLDARSIGRASLQAQFPRFWSLATSYGLDPATDAVPVTPAAHYWMGGLEVDPDGRTAVRGLFAVGEAACTGAHGANRLASNSLLEAFVTGHRAAVALATPWPDTVGAPSPVDSGTDSDTGTTPITRPELQDLMWHNAGLHRSAEGLGGAARVLARARVVGETVHDLETSNLLQIARAVIAAASARTESVGAHFRTDAPALPARSGTATESGPVDAFSGRHREVSLPC